MRQPYSSEFPLGSSRYHPVFVPLVGRRKYKEAALGLATAALLVIGTLTALGRTPGRRTRN